MPIYKTLSEAVQEVCEHLELFTDVGAFIVKGSGPEPYIPIYVLWLPDQGNKIEKVASHTTFGEVVAMFATIR